LSEPRREHARFCPARCRVARNREHAGDPKAGDRALGRRRDARRHAADRRIAQGAAIENIALVQGKSHMPAAGRARAGCVRRL
jgi:hypothetical protein